MLVLILRRMLSAIITLAVISIATFGIIQLPPGDFLSAYVARLESQGDTVDTETIDRLRAQYGLNKPLIVQYGKWMQNVLRGDFGMSFQWGRPVRELIGERLLLTVAVAGAAVIFMWVLAIPIGVFSAMRYRSWSDYVLTFVGFIGLAVPDFLLALMLMYLSYHWLDMDVTGLFSPEYTQAHWSVGRVWDLIMHLWVPAIVLGTAGTAALIRTLRANLLDELKQPYITTARAKGLSYPRAVFKYALRIAINPLVSTSGYIFPFLVSGSVIVSVVLGLPTVGPLLLGALKAQDMYLAGAIILMLAAMTILGTFVSDIALMYLDPRIRLDERQ